MEQEDTTKPIISLFPWKSFPSESCTQICTSYPLHHVHILRFHEEECTKHLGFKSMAKWKKNRIMCTVYSWIVIFIYSWNHKNDAEAFLLYYACRAFVYNTYILGTSWWVCVRKASTNEWCGANKTVLCEQSASWGSLQLDAIDARN